MVEARYLHQDLIQIGAFATYNGLVRIKSTAMMSRIMDVRISAGGSKSSVTGCSAAGAHRTFQQAQVQRQAWGCCSRRQHPHACTRDRGNSVRLQASEKGPSALQSRSEGDQVTLRSEAEAPFRSLRLTLFGFSIVSASVGFLVSVPQLIGALGGAQNALQLNDVLTNIGIDLGAVAIFAFLFWRDWQARDKQIARLGREEKLGALQVQLANNKSLPLSQLRGSARVVIVAGSRKQVADGLAAAEPYKEALKQRGVVVVPLPIFGAGSDDASVPLPSPSPQDLRWLVTPQRTDDWADWFTTQLKFSTKAKLDNGLFVGLRMDGRVRSSGMGLPPWARYAAELAPTSGDGSWTGFFDGFDGRV